MRIILAIAALLMLAFVGCSTNDSEQDVPTLVIGGIPDQDVSRLEERFGGIASYLSKELDIPIEYQPVTDYASLVTAFRNGDVKLSWFGGLTGVQARLATPGADALLQRPLDTEFHSVVVIRSGVEANSLSDLKGKSFTFGSESSTSGHMMPRWYLTQAGIDAETDFRGPPSYSRSHDTTWKLVESGSFDAGALNAAVWERAVREGTVDTTKVHVLENVGPYFDYHWVGHPQIDTVYGTGTTERIRAALRDMDLSEPAEKKLLDLFETDSFIDTENANYEAIEETARELDLIS